MDLIVPVFSGHRGSKFGGLATLLEWMQEMNCVWVGLRSSPYGRPCIDEQPAMQGTARYGRLATRCDSYVGKRAVRTDFVDVARVDGIS